MRVIVCRTGSTWHGIGSKVSTLTSQKNHDAVVETLRLAGHDVLCLGKINGELPNGVDQCSWDGRPGTMNHSELVKIVEGWQPEVWVECCGAAPTNVDPDNERGSVVQAATWRYWYPAHVLLRELKLPRICVVTDVRCYPREQEINWFDFQRPAAILSQENAIISRRILDTKWSIHARYAAIERLRLRGIEPMPIRADAKGCIAIAHGHAEDKRISRDRTDVWLEISKCMSTIDVYGEGWEWYTENELFGALLAHAALPHEEIWNRLNYSTCGPLVPMRHGWISPKYGEYALAGCVPLVHGHGGPLTYDAGGLVVPLDDATRFRDSRALNALIALCSQYSFRCEQIEIARERFKIDDRVLLECVDHFGRGYGANVERFGGMTQ